MRASRVVGGDPIPSHFDWYIWQRKKKGGWGKYVCASSEGNLFHRLLLRCPFQGMCISILRNSIETLSFLSHHSIFGSQVIVYNAS